MSGVRKVDFSRLSNKQLFDWIQTHRSKTALLALGERWISFWETVKDRIARAEERIREVQREIEDMDSKVSRLESRLAFQRSKQMDKKLHIIQNNLLSVERQLKEREPEPKPLIPESQWEAFEEFLIKLNGNKR